MAKTILAAVEALSFTTIGLLASAALWLVEQLKDCHELGIEVGEKWGFLTILKLPEGSDLEPQFKAAEEANDDAEMLRLVELARARAALTAMELRHAAERRAAQPLNRKIG